MQESELGCRSDDEKFQATEFKLCALNRLRTEKYTL